MYSKLTDLLPSAVTSEDDPELQRPSVEEIEDTTEKTRQALEKLTQVRHPLSDILFVSDTSCYCFILVRIIFPGKESR